MEQELILEYELLYQLPKDVSNTKDLKNPGNYQNML